MGRCDATDGSAVLLAQRNGLALSSHGRSPQRAEPSVPKPSPLTASWCFQW
jgi:hypothetical protein